MKYISSESSFERNIHEYIVCQINRFSSTSIGKRHCHDNSIKKSNNLCQFQSNLNIESRLCHIKLKEMNKSHFLSPSFLVA